MITKEVIEYVRREVSRGTPYPVIKENILKTGWNEADFAEMMQALNPQEKPPVVVEPAAPAIPHIEQVQLVTPSSAPISIDPVVHTMSPQSSPISSQAVNIAQPAVMPSTMPMSPIAQVTSMPQSVNTMASHMETPAVVTMPPTHSSKKKVILLIACIVVFFLLIGTAVYGYVGGYFVSPEKTIASALATAHGSKTVSMDMDLTIDVSGMKNPNSAAAEFLPGLGNVFTVNVKGSSDATDLENPKATSTMSIVAGDLHASIDTRMIDGTVYLNLTKAPSIPFLPLTQIENKWFSFSSKEGQSSSLPIDGSLLKSLTEEQKQHLYDLGQKAHIAMITKHLSSETVNGTLSYHYQFDIDRAGLKAYLTEIANYMQEVDKDDPRLANFDTTTIPKSISDFIDSIHDFSGELWIGVFNHSLEKVSLVASVGDSAHPEIGDAKVLMTLSTTDWNKPVTVEVPANSVPFETFMAGLFGGPDPSQDMIPCIPGPGAPCSESQEAPANAKDAAIQAGLKNMRAQGDLYSGNNASNYKGACSADSSVNHVKGLYSIAKSLPAGTDYHCRDSAASYVAWAKLSTGQYFCVDSTNYTKLMPQAPKANLCQ
jgi:hypothetical protein